MSNNPTAEDLASLGDSLFKHEDELLTILCYISTYKAAKQEIAHAVDTLHGAADELSHFGGRRIESLATYLPSNVILFSYVLYAVLPTVYSCRVSVRPSLRGREVAWSVHDLIRRLMPLPISFEMHKSRRGFWTDDARPANAVAFTGQCANAAEVAELIEPGQLFMYFGSGVNPIVIGPQALLDRAAQDVTTIRTLNSGQDCLGPDLVLVHTSVEKRFLDILEERVTTLQYGPMSSPVTDYSNLVYPNTAELCLEQFQVHSEHIRCGGSVNVLDRLVEPTIIVRAISQFKSYDRDFPEFFAPVFNIGTYSDPSEIETFVAGSSYRPHAMGASLYGAEELHSIFQENHVVTENATLTTTNFGNHPFGGYGECASYIKYNGAVSCRPVLISREVASHLLEPGTAPAQQLPGG